MSEQFYNYLSEKIINFFKDNPLISGAKYNIQFETEEQVKNLYEALKDNTLRENYEYLNSDGSVKYKSYCLNFNGIKLIVASTANNVQPDFLTRLRNIVGLEHGYEDKAILFIHNTTLDSIIGGTESFSKEGMPFYISSIENDIRFKLNKSDFSEVDKEIIILDLEKRNVDFFEDNKSIFEYKDILEIINGTCIEKDKYKNFGLFFDSKIQEYTGKELKDRLRKNSDYFYKVHQIHNYGDPETQLEKYFDEKGIEKLKNDNWKEVDFKQVLKSVEDKKNTKLLEYISGSEEWDRGDGSSKAKSRIRNIIVFNNDNLEYIDNIEFTFDDYLKQEYLKTDGEIEAITSGKKIKAKIKNIEGKSNFYKITYNDDSKAKFEFKIVMLQCSESYFESIKAKFTIYYRNNNKYISINTNDSSLILNSLATKEINYDIIDNYQIIDLNEDEKLILSINDNFKYENDSDLVNFKINIKGRNIPFAIKGCYEKPSVIEGLRVWKEKREKQSDFKLVEDDKLQQRTKEYFTRADFRRNLDREKKILNLEGLYFEEKENGLEAINLELSEPLTNAYNNIIKYFKINNKLPSLTNIDGELKSLYEEYILCYINEINSIKEGHYLEKREKDLFNLGVIKRKIEDREILFTPLHPLNIAYQLKFVNEVKNEKLDDDIIKRFSYMYLLPYINEDDKLYVPIEQFHSPEWRYYVNKDLPRYKSSRNFVVKLVCEKIEEFTNHFKYMFDMNENAPIKINLINTGDSKEILQGIFRYYVKQLKNLKEKNLKEKDILPIELYIYSEENITNAFEEVALNDNIESVKSLYGINLSVDNMSERDILDFYYEKVKFYSKKISEEIEYAHITFLEMNDSAKIVPSNIDNISSGVILNGLLSGVPSVFLGDCYRTGFGIKYANTDSKLMNIAIKLNALNSALSGAPFNSKQCKTISVSNEKKTFLDKIYDSSHWVTFIDPKVDLNFFKNDPNAKDLLIIHYSDQYTTTGGYDAITVTRKSNFYQRVIEEFLKDKNVENADKFSPNIINMFNAVNGDWLLRLLSSKSYFPKEKISILSAIKLALAKFKRDDIIWVPISLEEILRVSGGAGLKQNEGLFSAKKLGFKGSASDDILLVGIEEVNKEIKVHYYPIEVKIGNNENSYIKKGIEQVTTTKKLFDENLLSDENGVLNITKKVYRNFLMQLVITSAEKLSLYNICECEKEKWQKVFDSDLRRKLLNEEYEISNSFDKDIGEAALISFKAGATSNISEKQDNVMIIEMSEEDGIDFITKTVEEIYNKINNIEENSISFKNIETTIPKTINFQDEKEKPIIDNRETLVIKENSVLDVPKENFKNEYEGMKILFGTNQNNNKKVFWYPNNTNKVFHTNTGIIGTMGTGKTQFTKSLVTQIYRESKNNIDGKKVGVLIFDYKGDYNQTKEDFIEATNAKVFNLYHLPFNPLSIVQEGNSKPMLPLHIANTLKETLSKAFVLGIKQETLLRDLIMEAYEKKGIIKNKPETWNNPAPTLQDVYDAYIEREDLKEDSLYATFSNLIEFEIFEPNSEKTKSLFDLIDGVTVIDLSGYDPGIQNLVVAITLDLFYSQMQAYGHSTIDGSLRQMNKIILVDEADNFLNKNFSSLKKILKEGREFGVGTILSTQLLSHFSTTENEYANYILTWIIHNVSDLSNKDVRYIFNTQNKQEEENIYNRIKNLTKHHSLVKMGNCDRPIYMKDKAFWELEKE